MRCPLEYLRSEQATSLGVVDVLRDVEDAPQEQARHEIGALGLERLARDAHVRKRRRFHELVDQPRLANASFPNNFEASAVATFHIVERRE